MKWTLVWTRPALKDMKELEPVLARRLREAMIELAETGHGDVADLRDECPDGHR